MTHALVSRIVDWGGAVYDLTQVDRWSVGARRVEVITTQGHRIRARHEVVWDGGSPCLYLCSTPDGRIIAGGRDGTFRSAGKRDALIRRKSGEITRDVRKRFPDRPFEVDFAWAGSFGQTRDRPPYIGTFGSRRTHYALDYGGNGITFSVVAAQAIADANTGVANADAKVLAFDR